MRALIDTGAGNTMGPTLGKLADNLRAAGAPPERIDTILLTHLHSDHSNGLVDDDDRAIYPNAQLVLHEAEAAFWLDRDEASGANERIRRNIAKARVTTGPYRERMRTVRDGEALPGVSAMLLAGHTPGPYRMAHPVAQSSLLVWGDIVHLAAIQVPRPEAALVFDVDPQAAAATRRRLFDHVAADKLTVAGAHLGFPGFRHHRAQRPGLRLRTGRVRIDCRNTNAANAMNRTNGGGMHGRRFRSKTIICATVISAARAARARRSARAQERGPLALASAELLLRRRQDRHLGRRQPAWSGRCMSST